MAIYAHATVLLVIGIASLCPEPEDILPFLL
jgi:hypothetical protein